MNEVFCILKSKSYVKRVGSVLARGHSKVPAAICRCRRTELSDQFHTSNDSNQPFPALADAILSN